MLDIAEQTPLGIKCTAIPPNPADNVRNTAPSALITAADLGGIVIPETPSPNAAQKLSEETAAMRSRHLKISEKVNIL